jgi:hypothetical protein
MAQDQDKGQGTSFEYHVSVINKEDEEAVRTSQKNRADYLVGQNVSVNIKSTASKETLNTY